MNKILIPTGYMGSGSSAVTDLLNEYECNHCPRNNFEFVFLHCPNGLFDLIDKLIYNNNGLKSSTDIAIFRNQMKKLYDKKLWWVGNYKNNVSKDFMNITDSFIDKLIDNRYEGYWYVDEEINLKMLIQLIVRKPFKIIFKNHHFKKILNSDGIMKISLKSEEEIYAFAREYVYRVLNSIDDSSKNLILDQLILPFNSYRSDKLFDDKARIIIVERDPRDVFVLNKYVWGKKDCPIAIPQNVKDFCKYYKKMRAYENKVDTKKVLRIHFEDLVYNYESTKKRIEKFVELSPKEHTKKLKTFDPQISVKNTQIFRNEEFKEEVSIIEKELSEYLYDFPYILKNGTTDTVEFFESDRYEDSK